MICDPLAYTGPGVHVSLLLTSAAILLVVGAVILLMNRRRGRVVAGVLLFLLCAATMSITAGAPAQARSQDCPAVNNSLTIIQTSVMAGLAPEIPPVPITGIVSNNGPDSTYLAAIDVKIVGVLPAPGSPPGVCDRSDYLLLNTLMPVARTLAPGGSTTFAGAAIGLRNKSSNQDTCQGATIQLLYTANPD